MIVEAGLRVVEVCQLRDVVDSLLSLFQDGHADSHVVGRSQVLSIRIPEVFFLDVSEKLSIESA